MIWPDDFIDKIIYGDCLEVMKEMPDESIHCCVTSPPYWGLRDYGVEGQIGLEKTPEEYVLRLVEVFREVRRVLRKDGSLWLNLGDSYIGGGRGGKGQCGKGSLEETRYERGQKIGLPTGKIKSLKPKDLCGISWWTALAFQADGWWLRSDIIWSKPNPMPESVSGSRWEKHRIKVAEWQNCPGCSKCSPNDGYILRMSAGRPTRSHEYIFLLTKSEKYFFDSEAVRELANYDGRKDTFMKGSQKYSQSVVPGQAAHTFASRGHERWPAKLEDGSPGRNVRSVWTMITKPFKEAHFATFPPQLPERCIKAGTSEKGVCLKCGSPWVRILKNIGKERVSWGVDRKARILGTPGKPAYKNINEAVGWRPSCNCKDAGDPVPAIVLDPFVGAGTTCYVAKELGRDYIGIDLKKEYCDMAEKKLAQGVL